MSLKSQGILSSSALAGVTSGAGIAINGNTISSTLGSSVVKTLAVNLNATGDAASMTGLPANIILDRLEVSGWSVTPAVLLAMTVRDAAAGAGNSLVGAIGSLNGIITSTAMAAIATPLAAVLGASRVISTTAFYLNVSVANGTALTANVSVYYHTL